MGAFQNPLFIHSFDAAAQSDIGAWRRSNQDEVLCCPDLSFFAVSDGMGGLEHGGDASRHIVESLPSLVAQCLQKADGNLVPQKAARDLEKQIQALSDELYLSENMGLSRSTWGATLCAAWLIGEKAILFSIGDSRGYVVRDSSLVQLTSDQNQAWWYVEHGILTKEEALSHPGSSRLTAFVGMAPPADIQVTLTDLHPGETLLLCTDGLYSMVPEEKILALLKESTEADQTASLLISEANRAGGRDNIGLALIRILEEPA